jgi:cytochrome b
VAILEAIIGPVSKLLDKIIPDPQARDRAKLELLKLQGDQEMATITAQMQAIVAEAQSNDPWTSRARPSFLYMMYALVLWSVPMGLIAAADPGWRKELPRDDGLSPRHSGGALRALRHRLSRLHGRAHLG